MNIASDAEKDIQTNKIDYSTKQAMEAEEYCKIT